MIIIGVLIGGVFGGMKLIENMQVNKTIQDLKAIESATLTFKDTYGRLPGDITNPSTRLPNCTVAPCATGGNGNRRIDFTSYDDAITATDERFTLWQHLQAADLLSLGTKNTTDMNFGEGQPDGPISGYRIVAYNGRFLVSGSLPLWSGAIVFIGTIPSAATTLGPSIYGVLPCTKFGAVDRKMDDGLVYMGLVNAWPCGPTGALTDEYLTTGPITTGSMWYDLKGF
jgi:hypothetical protein